MEVGLKTHNNTILITLLIHIFGLDGGVLVQDFDDFLEVDFFSLFLESLEARNPGNSFFNSGLIGVRYQS